MKTILVTGTRLGIGRAIAIKLLAKGFKVIGTSRQAAKNKLDHKNFKSVYLDLKSIAYDENIIIQFKLSCGKIDGMILNAGYGRFASLEEFSTCQINDLLEVNLLAPVQLVRAFVADFKKKRSGDIVFIGSESALKGAKMGSVYSAAKFGLRGFSQSLRHECAGSNIRVSLVNPGMVASSFFDDLSFEPGKATENSISPGQIADAIVLVLDSDVNVVWDEINLSPLKKVVIKR